MDSLRRIQGSLYSTTDGNCSHVPDMRAISLDPLPHIIEECPAADSQARYTAKLIVPLVLAELNSYILSFVNTNAIGAVL